MESCEIILNCTEGKTQLDANHKLFYSLAHWVCHFNTEFLLLSFYLMSQVPLLYFDACVNLFVVIQ